MQKQRFEYDCVLTCVSMISGKNYEQIFDPEFCAKIERMVGCQSDEIVEAFKRAGLEKDVDYKCVYTGYDSAAIVNNMLWGRKAMIQVDSLNYEKGMHMIYWDGKEIHDPSNKQVYKWMSHVRPVYVWIFNHA